MIIDADAFHKYRELKVLHPFSQRVTVDEKDIRIAFGDNAFRYWGEMGIVKFNLENPEDVSRFLQTKFVMHVGEVVV